MGGADFITVLFAEFLRYDPDNMTYPYRDRFFLDPGHMSPMLYSTLALAGHYSTEDLQSLRQWGQRDAGPPRGGRAARRGEHLGPAGAGARHGFGRRHRGAFHGRALRRVDGAQDLCLYLGRRRRGGDFAGRGPHRRPSGPVELRDVLRLEQHPALDEGR